MYETRSQDCGVQPWFSALVIADMPAGTIAEPVAGSTTLPADIGVIMVCP